MIGKTWIDYEEWKLYNEYKNNYKEYMSKNNAIKYIPYGKNILVEVPKEDIAFANGSLISLDQVSDAEIQRLGGSTKAANVANRSGEEQVPYKIVALGPKVDTTEVTIGDKWYVKPAVQATTIELEGKFYFQFEEFWLLGKLLK